MDCVHLVLILFISQSFALCELKFKFKKQCFFYRHDFSKNDGCRPETENLCSYYKITSNELRCPYYFCIPDKTIPTTEPSTEFTTLPSTEFTTLPETSTFSTSTIPPHIEPRSEEVTPQSQTTFAINLALSTNEIGTAEFGSISEGSSSSTTTEIDAFKISSTDVVSTSTATSTTTSTAASLKETQTVKESFEQTFYAASLNQSEYTFPLIEKKNISEDSFKSEVNFQSSLKRGRNRASNNSVIFYKKNQTVIFGKFVLNYQKNRTDIYKMGDEVECINKVCFLQYKFMEICILYFPVANSSCNIPCEFNDCIVQARQSMICPIWVCEEKPTTTTAPNQTTTSTTSSTTTYAPLTTTIANDAVPFFCPSWMSYFGILFWLAIISGAFALCGFLLYKRYQRPHRAFIDETENPPIINIQRQSSTRRRSQAGSSVESPSERHPLMTSRPSTSTGSRERWTPRYFQRAPFVNTTVLEEQELFSIASSSSPAEVGAMAPNVEGASALMEEVQL